MRIMELLLAAGCKPSVYQNVWVAEDGAWDLPVHMATFDPLQDKRNWFPLQGRGRCAGVFSLFVKPAVCLSQQRCGSSAAHMDLDLL